MSLWTRLLASGLLLIGLSGCNLFGGIDSPSGDAQIASAARACLDQGDYACALSNYQKLSSADSDITNSESAYAVFDQNGATFGAFAAGFGNFNNVNIGQGLTVVANSVLSVIYPNGSAATTRYDIYQAFLQYKQITDNPSLAAMVEFLGAVAFAGEILAEIASQQNSSSLTTAIINSNTAVPCSGASSSSSLDQVSASTIQAGATFNLLNAALGSIGNAITSLAASGNLAQSFNSTVTTLLGVGCAGGTAAYNTGLTHLQVGTTP
jgi:hypothetical protein